MVHDLPSGARSMTGPIPADRFDQLCEAERRMKFLEAFALKHNGIHIRLDGPFQTFTENVDAMMAEHPELLEDRTEVQVNG